MRSLLRTSPYARAEPTGALSSAPPLTLALACSACFWPRCLPVCMSFADLVGLLLGLGVGAGDELGGGLAAAKAEGQCHAEPE